MTYPEEKGNEYSGRIFDREKNRKSPDGKPSGPESNQLKISR